jgi:hypothetical protein
LHPIHGDTMMGVVANFQSPLFRKGEDHAQRF